MIDWDREIPSDQRLVDRLRDRLEEGRLPRHDLERIKELLKRLKELGFTPQNREN